MADELNLVSDDQRLSGLTGVRSGTAFFQRWVDALTDSSLDGASRLPNWSRRHVVAHVAYNAQALARLVDWAKTGVENPMYASAQARNDEIMQGALLPAGQLRELHLVSLTDLDQAWRATPAEVWQRKVRTGRGNTIALSETLWMRTREVWLHAVDLNNGAEMGEIPREVLRRLLGEITARWRESGVGRDIAMEITDDEGTSLCAVENEQPVRGTLAAVVGWASGRTTSALEAGSHVRNPPWI